MMQNSDAKLRSSKSNVEVAIELCGGKGIRRQA